MSVRVIIGGQELTGFTSLRLSRKKEDMTGVLELGIFMGYIPEEPVLVEAVRGQDVAVYIENQLVFWGTLDRRRDQGSRQENNISADLNIGPNDYSVNFIARGKTKYLVDCSHQHPTGNMLNTDNQTVIETLVAPFNITVDWQAAVTPLNRIRFRDGARVIEEIVRVAEMTSLYFYELPNGDLRVLDGPTEATGEPIHLGTNILQFSTDIAEDPEYQQVLVKGQLVNKGEWGAPAVIPTLRNIENLTVPTLRPITVQLYGNATEELLDRRAQYEINRRVAKAKQIKVEVFHIQQTNGRPWDIGEKHHVSIPPAGVQGIFEVTELTYIVDNDKTLKTSLTLSPPPDKAPEVDQNSYLAELANDTDNTDNAGETEDANQWSSPITEQAEVLVEDQTVGSFGANLQEFQTFRPPSTL